jgi:hypothetical protein
LEPEDRKASGSRSPTPDAADNVVRFPKEWLGPREELVPFGPVAEPPEGEVASVDGGAADFWGEDSAAVQAVVEGAPTGEVAGSSVGSRPRVIVAGEAAIRRALALFPTALSGIPRRGLVVGVMFVALVLVITGSVLGAGGQTRRPRAHRPVISEASISAGDLPGVATRHARSPQPRLIHRSHVTRTNRSHSRRSSALHGALPNAKRAGGTGVTPLTSQSPGDSPADGNQAVSSASQEPVSSETPPTYSSQQHSTPAVPPAQPSSSGALTCISNCG